MLEQPRGLPALIQDLEERSSVCPDDRDLLLKLGRLHARNGAWAASVRTYRRLLAQDPENITALIEIGVSLSRLGLAEEARFHLERAQELAPNSAGVFLALAAWHEASGNLEQQVVALQRAARLSTDRPEIKLKIAEIMCRHGDTPGAIAQYRQLLETHPHLEAAHFALGVLLMRRNELNEAMREFTAVITHNPTAFDAHLNLAQCLYRQGKFALAIPSFTFALKGLKDNPSARFMLARCFEKTGDWDRALVLLEQLAETHPDHLEINRTLAETYERAGESRSALDVFARMAARHPERPEFAMRQAEFLLAERRYDKAAAVLQGMFAAHPGHIDGHRLLGEVFAAQGKPKDALDEFQKTLLVNESFLPGWLGSAAMYRRLERPRDEYRVLERALGLDPGNAEILFRLAQLERELKIPTSLDRFRKVMEVAPDSVQAREAGYYLRHQRVAAAV